MEVGYKKIATVGIQKQDAFPRNDKLIMQRLRRAGFHTCRVWIIYVKSQQIRIYIQAQSRRRGSRRSWGGVGLWLPACGVSLASLRTGSAAAAERGGRTVSPASGSNYMSWYAASTIRLLDRLTSGGHTTYAFGFAFAPRNESLASKKQMRHAKNACLNGCLAKCMFF